MKDLAVDACLLLAVASAWLAAAGLVRLRTTLDRLHVATFVIVSTGGPLTLAAWLDEGVTARSTKLALAVAVLLIGGAAGTHAVARAIAMREGVKS